MEMSNNLQTITSQLWAMANELLGTMDAAEYKNHILAFIFYHYLSENQEDYLIENNILDGENDQAITRLILNKLLEMDCLAPWAIIPGCS